MTNQTRARAEANRQSLRYPAKSASLLPGGFDESPGDSDGINLSGCAIGAPLSNCACWSAKRSSDGIFVNDFAIEPEICVRLPGKRDTLSLRSIDAAADFVRERLGRNPNRMWAGVLYRLEAARTKEDAIEAANALRALLEAEGSLLTERH